MGAFLSYAIGSGILLLVLFLVFILTLSSENQHAYNRCIILSIYAVSFLSLPLLHLIQGMIHNRSVSPSALSDLSDLTMMVTSVGVSQHHAPLWGTILIWIFLAGMAVMLVRTVMAWIQIARLVSSGEKILQQENGKEKGKYEDYTLVLIDDERLSPFSWMRYVVMSRKDYEQNGETILAHELSHIGLYHWIDLLIAQAVIIINWFNPASWLMREELMLIHEYQADMCVIKEGYNAKEYQMLLIRKAVGPRLPSLANSLSYNKLKQRISMMYKEKSRKESKLKALALVPAVAVALAVVSIPQVKAAMSTIASSETTLSKVTDNSANSQSQVTVTTCPTSDKEKVAVNTDEITVVGCGTMEKPNTWEDVKVVRVRSEKKIRRLSKFH